ncbi:hypothetical protein M8C21_012300, partial [Ambrosia artemisiifolia]
FSNGVTTETRSCSLTSSKRRQIDKTLESRRHAVRAWWSQPIQSADPGIFEMLEQEKQRQYKGIELIASENYVCKAVMQALGSHLTNKDFKGMPGERYYTGNQYIDEIESLCCQRALAAFELDSTCWGVLDFHPKILVCGGCSYPRYWDYAKFRQIANKCGAVLMCDMAQISGLIAAKECASPFEFCDIVTSTTHKSLSGPRGGIIFYRKGSKLTKRGMLLNQGDGSDMYDLEEKINFAGGPHKNHIAALAIALKQLGTPEYKAYMQQVKKLQGLRNFRLTGKNFEKVCDMCHITVNKIPIFDDHGTMVSGVVRINLYMLIRTPAMTSRGCLESDFETMAGFLFRAALIARDHSKMAKEILKNGLENNKDIVDLRTQVENFATQFAMPGQDV